MKPKSAGRVQSPGKARTALRAFLYFSATAVFLPAVVRVFPSLGAIDGNVGGTLGLILALAALNTSIWMLLVRGILSLFEKISPAFMFVTFAVISLMLPALFMQIASWFSVGLVIHGFGSAVLIALLLAAISLSCSSVFASDDESVIYQGVLERTDTKLAAGENTRKPGIVFLEIDGLSGKVLKDAMDMGKTPYMKRWVDVGTHKLVLWDSDLSSQSSAAQAGILHGTNFGIPAFRWYDKEKRSVVVSSSIEDVSQLEKQLSNGNGLLSGGGTARASLLSGDANRASMTASRIFDVASDELRAYYAYFMYPSSVLRSLSLMVWDWVLEKKAAWGQRLRDEKPRVNRGGIYFFLRSLMTVLLRDFSLFALKLDMYSGVPYVYVTLAGYDEVSHHSGIKRPDTLEVLRKLDREIGRLVQVSRHAARKYELVVLSDHGQTQGATFRDRYGERLVDVVRRFASNSGKEGQSDRVWDQI